MIPFGSMVECSHHVLRKTSQGSINVGKKVLLGIFLRICTDGRIWKGDILVADIEELEIWTRRKPMLEDSMQRKLQRRWEVVKTYIFHNRGW